MRKLITDAVTIAQTKTEAIGTTIEPLKVFASIFALSALAGVALLLSDRNKKLGFRVIFGSALISGIIGLGIALLWWSQFGQTDLYFLVGVSMLAGMGGNSTLGILYMVACKKLGLERLLKEIYENESEDSEEN